MITNTDMKGAARLRDEAIKTLVQYTQRTDGSPWDQNKYDALLEQVKARAADHNRLAEQLPGAKRTTTTQY